MDKGTSMTWRGSIKFQFTKATRQRWVFREERNCASVEANLKDNGREFQIAGPAYEKEVEPYFFDLTDTIRFGREDQYRRELSGSYRLTWGIR
jgi:hypothetical protein